MKKQSYKALRQSKKRYEKNRVIKAALKTSIKKTRQSIVAKNVKVEDLRKTLKEIDKAAQKKLIKKNTASRKKSRIMKQFNKSQKA